MTTAWTRGIAVGLLVWPLACEVRVTDDLDGVGGVAGSTGGRGGFGGSAGRGGTSGSAGQGGAGGGELFPTPTCGAEPQDDVCIQCLKDVCCTEWVGCDDQTCSEEWTDVAACVSEYDFAPNEDEFGMCVSDSSADDSGLPQPNTRALLDCINVEVPPNDGGADTTQCGFECWGSDIFFFD